MGDLHMSFTGIIEILEDINNQETDDLYTKAIANAMHKKISEYWIDIQNACPASVILDPNIKSECYNEEVKHTVHRQLHGIYKNYTNNDEMEIQSTVVETSSRGYFMQRLRRSSANAYQTSNTLNDYLMTPLETCETLGYWKMRMTDSRFVKLAIMARDYLIAQATSVASEQVFSIAKHTISPVRNRLDEKKVRASLCLKSWYETGLLEGEYVNVLVNVL